MLSTDLIEFKDAVSMILEDAAFADGPNLIRVKRQAFVVIAERLTEAAAAAARLEARLALVSPTPRIAALDAGDAGNVLALDDYRRPKGDAA